ncbi:MAG TPA: ATP-binding protein [Vicinamibacteria bacterium]|nr:ATP-binding protein [Vicinamibacteria bacterium]
MTPFFERAELLGEAARARQGPPLLLTGPPGAGKTTLLRMLADAVRAEGGEPVYLDLMGAATSPERFVLSALATLPEGMEGRAAARAREAAQLAQGGRAEGLRAVQALFATWAALDAVDGRPVVLLLDEVTEIRSLAYFAGLREVDAPLGAALSSRARGTILATSFPGLARRRWPQLATLPLPPLSALELQAEARRRGLRVDGESLATASMGWPRYARVLLDRLLDGMPLVAAWAEEMALGGRLEQACRHTYEVLLLRSRGYGMSKAVLSAVAAEEGLNLTALVARLGRTPGAIRDYLGWLLAVDALRTARKRYYYVDGVLRSWVLLHARGVVATEVEILERARLAATTLSEAPAAPAALPRRQEGLIEID